ncbi:hypothetical protein J3R75_000172 [Oligosphaera ethanolica]|uniref:Uncharacterized protein n=1 Tax=Oligosphaera ethanolica TaxID=760260 RepID=A0AAE3VCQ6_9BACT|nr:hypothetical protein [Oligosphaera ethanolica]
MDARHAADVNLRQASEFHCLFGPSQLRRLWPKRPRNTNIVAVVPRAARAFGAACPGLVCFALSALLPLRGQGNGHAWLRTKLYGSIVHDSYETRCRKGRRKSRPDGWAATDRGFPANCTRCFPTRVVIYRLRLAAVEWASRPLRQDGLLHRPRHPRRPYPARLRRPHEPCAQRLEAAATLGPL